MLKKIINCRTALCLATIQLICYCFCRTHHHFQTNNGKLRCLSFEWRPIDCGNGNYFAILVGGNTFRKVM